MNKSALKKPVTCYGDVARYPHVKKKTIVDPRNNVPKATRLFYNPLSPGPYPTSAFSIHCLFINEQYADAFPADACFVVQ
jgi:hypothetical protein